MDGERFETRDEMKAVAFECIELFYKRKCLHSMLGYKSPTRFLRDWLTAQQNENWQHEAHLVEDKNRGRGILSSNGYWLIKSPLVHSPQVHNNRITLADPQHALSAASTA